MDDDALRELGLQILRRRERLEMSQDELADKATLSKNYVGHIERGKVNPSYLVLLKLANALDCQVADFFPDVRQRLSAQTMAAAQLLEGASPAVREAVITLLLAKPRRQKGT